MTLRSLGRLACIASTLACTASAPAQEAEPVYLVLGYMRAAPEQVEDYLELERDVWKPIHRERIREGDMRAWSLYAVRFPGGVENDYNFVTVNVYDDLADIERTFDAQNLQQLSVAGGVAGLEASTYAVRDSVRTELWVSVDQAAMGDDGDSGPSRYVLVDYMRVDPASSQAYLDLEQNVFKPIHEERIRAGKLENWALYRLMLPRGAAQGYNFSTANFVDSLTDLENPYPAEAVSRAASDTDFADLRSRAAEAREMVKSELWELVDHVE